MVPQTSSFMAVTCCDVLLRVACKDLFADKQLTLDIGLVAGTLYELYVTVVCHMSRSREEQRGAAAPLSF